MRKTGIIRDRLRSTSALTGVASALALMASAAPSSALAQSCVATPPDNNCIVVFYKNQASGDTTGQSAPANVNMTFSPPTSFNGDTNDAGVRWLLQGQQGGNATEHGETGGTGGNGAQSLSLTINPGVTVEGSTFQGAINLKTAGGAGGQALYGLDSSPTAASGGQSGTIDVTINGTVTASTTSIAVFARSQGGDGGAGHDGGVGETAANGGMGTNGQRVSLTQGGIIKNTTAAGVSLSSLGGFGQSGGNDNAGAITLSGGEGGSGGDAGSVSYTLSPGGTLTATGGYGASLLSQGGDGGSGGNAKDKNDKIIDGTGGNGADAGFAGKVTVNILGALTVSNVADVGLFSGLSTGIGVLAQSFGGEGGNGGNAAAPIGGAGGGGSARAGGEIDIGGTGSITTQGGSESQGIIAQSIGGGGGIGGSDNNGAFAVGGNGGNGADGGLINANLGLAISTTGKRSAGLLAQSIGGGGGAAGSVSGTSVVYGYIVGGTAGFGGNGGQIQTSSSGTISTQGAHSSGLILQSIGGGGGAGGSAIGVTLGGFAGSSVALGGAGGAGGIGNTVGQALDGNGNGLATNAGTISTTGSDSFGILGQSIGGGGGVGGASAAEAKVYSVSTDPPIPTLSVAVAIGGSGGAGGNGGSVTLVNSGLITTSGAGGIGVIGQSIGGGGGTGGDSSAVATAKGSNEDSFTISMSISAGGNAGGTGNGGAVTLNNTGFIVTTGQAGDAMMAQSIGGGGGNGGGADGKATSSGDGTSISTTLTLGGQASSGGNGGILSVMNSGALITLGDGAAGMMMQTVGGGGGRGGGAAGTSAGDFSASVNVGGNGGSGGNTTQGNDNSGNPIDTINITNGGSIVTFGADATGILAQSIGGGGGNGGKAASSLGSKKSTGDGGNGDTKNTVAPTVAALNSAFAAGGLDGLKQYNSVAGLTKLANCLLTDASGCAPNSATLVRVGDAESDADGLNDLGGSAGDSGDDSDSDSITVQVSVGAGGKAGGGGSAGAVLVTNNGSIGTVGAMSDGILAQAIGGGGGKGGAAISSTTKNDVQGSISVGGQGGSGGDGGAVTVINNGSVITTGRLSAAILAQSIAGGGGIGGASGAKVKPDQDSDSSVLSLPISVGGSGGGGGTAGQVTVTNGGGIITQSHDAIGIIAQSIAGGGGIVKTMSSDAEDNAGGAATAQGGSYGLNFKFGGPSGASGNSGKVNISTAANITTKGNNSHGILAQSIGGGGGLVLGGNAQGTSVSDFFGTGTTSGSAPGGSTVGDGVSVTVGATIMTYGEGAVGLLAQSIGGGGGIAGGITNQGNPSSVPTGFAGSKSASGSGGHIDITLKAGATIGTVGGYSPAIFLQSLGGGGGRVTTSDSLMIGTAGGSGQGGRIDALINGTVFATNIGSAGVFAQSMGDSESNSPITVTIGTTGKVVVGEASTVTAPYGASAAIYISHGGVDAAHANVVTNNGLVEALGMPAAPAAVYSSAGFTNVLNTGMMTGDVLLANDGGTGNFLNTGTYVSGNQIAVGTGVVTNGGTFIVNRTGAVGTTVVNGDFVQLASGKLNIDADFRGSAGDRLEISGKATITGTFAVNPLSVSNKSLTVLTATGGVTVDPALGSTDNSQLFDFKAQAGSDGKSLVIQPSANLAAAASSLGNNRQAAAGNLQSLFDSGASFDRGFNALLGVNDPASYARSLDALSGQALGALGAFRINSSRAFVGNLYGGCERHGVESVDGRCLWARAFYTSTTQDENTDELGYHAHATGLQLGGETQLSERWYLSGAVAYEHSRFRDDSRTARVKGDGVLGGVSLRYATGKLELSGALDAGYGWYQSRRQIVLGGLADQARAKPNQWEVGAHANAAYTFDLGSTGYARPYADLHVIHVHSQRFTETGNSPFNLAVDAQSQTAVAGGVGLEVGGRIPLKSGGTLRPFASAGVELASNSDWTTTARFVGQAGGDSFDIRTAAPNSYGRFAVGLELLGARNVDLSLSYNPEVGKDYVSHSGLAKLTYRF